MDPELYKRGESYLGSEQEAWVLLFLSALDCCLWFDHGCWSACPDFLQAMDAELGCVQYCRSKGL